MKLVLVTATLIAAVSVPAVAADISDLGNLYGGAVHHTTNSSLENSPIEFDVTDKQGANFKAELNGVPVTGKVTSSGKITFTGNISNSTGSVRIKKGKGQLSATGLFIVGSFQVQNNSLFLDSGNYTFRFALD